MSVEIICPLYKAEKYIKKLDESLKMQKKIDSLKITYLLTKCDDNTENYLKENNCNYEIIEKKDFSHSLTREKAAFSSKSDIIVFITQDVVITDEYWLYKLTKDIDDEIVATYSRQLTKYKNIEKYTRESNYPESSNILSKEDIKKYGLKTFFFSDASGAIKTDIFKKLNGYDQKKLPLSEDMYYAYKVIMNGYKIKYCSDSIVYHSHNFTIKEIYERYKLTGQFFKQNSYLDKYGTNNSGFKLAIYILKRILEDRNYKLLFRYPFDMGARFLGMKVGKM